MSAIKKSFEIKFSAFIDIDTSSLPPFMHTGVGQQHAVAKSLADLQIHKLSELFAALGDVDIELNNVGEI